MTDNRETCVDPYLDSFARSFAAANYTAGTIRTYRHLARPRASLRSLLLICADSAAFICRVSTQITDKPRFSQCAVQPLR